MNIEKKYELQKKRLERISQKNNELQAEVNALKMNEEKTKKLIQELEELKKDWSLRTKELKDKKYEYETLIIQLRILMKGLR